MNNNIPDPTIAVVYQTGPSKRDIKNNIPYEIAKNTKDDTINTRNEPPFKIPFMMPKNTPRLNLAIPNKAALSNIGLSKLCVAKNSNINNILIKYPKLFSPSFPMTPATILYRFPIFYDRHVL